MKKKMLYCLLYVVTIGWMILIFSFSNQSGITSSSLSMKVVAIPRTIFYPNFEELDASMQTQINSQLSFLVRKGAHMTEYALLCLFMFLSIKTVTKKYEPYVIAPAFCLLYAISDEFHQSMVSGRTMAFVDIVIDLSGSLIMLGIVFIIDSIIKRKKVKRNV